jgi:peptidoglycan/xylan/chitin deacetylase (PgdA/CDA1 family)
MAKEIFIAIGVDLDSIAGWLGSYGGQDSGHDISRGVFAAEVGTPRMLQLFKRLKIKTTWFIPGLVIETFPKQVEEIIKEDHEIGTHGYSHENPRSLTKEQEEAVMLKSYNLVKAIWGKAPVGHTSPWWEMSPHTIDLLIKLGYKYDRSIADNDFLPFYARTNRKWAKIDLTKAADEWMKPMYLGDLVDLVEFSANWMLDDLPPMMFIKAFPNSYGFTNPHDIEQIWRDEFDYLYREYDYGVFPLTLHPDVSGRPEVILMLERLFNYISRFPGVIFTTYEEVARDFRRRFPFDEYKKKYDEEMQLQESLRKKIQASLSRF